MTNDILNERPPRLDRLQLAALVGLMLLGAAFIYSARLAIASTATAPWYGQNWFRQVVWYVLGAGAGAVCCLADYRVLARWAMVVYWVSILPLAAVLVPGIGTTHGWGAMRWIDLAFFQFQPSEFAKLSFILAQAHFLSRPPDELRLPSIFLKSLGLLLLPFVLIMKEPDLGSALVLLPTGFLMMYVAGIPRRYLARLLAATAILGALFLVDVLLLPQNWQIKMQDYQRRRLMVYFGRDYAAAAPADTSLAERERLREQQFKDSHNVRQALISVGSGGLTGKGWQRGTQKALGYLPSTVAHNDFIFSVLAEEEGFAGSVTVLALYGIILFTGIRIAGEARDRLGKLLAAGVVALLFSHVFTNIGMNIRIMPVTGVPLPLLSYGGSSVLGSLIAMGWLQNVYMYRKAY
jgi:rod shape determining protein RodA